MKVLIIDQIGFGLSFAMRCAKAGHTVRWFVKPHRNNSPNIGLGFKGIQKIDNWLSSAKWADLVFCTTNDDYIEKLDSLRKDGVKVFGPTKKSADLEIKRSEGLKFLENSGIEVPEYKKFNSLSEAESYVKKTEERYVFKTLGDAEDKSLSYCSKSPADMVARLRRWQEMKMNPHGPVILQKFIPGVEFAVSCWMGSEGFIGKPNENFEHKKLMPGNFGPNTGEMGTICKYVEKSKLAETVLYPLEEKLGKLGHLGDIDINVIVDEKGKAWPLEFTARCGWPYFNLTIVAHKGDPVEWMFDACEGRDSMDVSPQITAGIVLSIPYFPYSDSTAIKQDVQNKCTEGLPIYGINSENSRFIQPQSVKIQKQPIMEGNKIVEKDMWTSCGDYLAVVTTLGKTVASSTKRAYEIVDEIDCPDMIVRNDIGKRLEKDLPAIQKHGYATEFKYE